MSIGCTTQTPAKRMLKDRKTSLDQVLTVALDSDEFASAAVVAEAWRWHAGSPMTSGRQQRRPGAGHPSSRFRPGNDVEEEMLALPATADEPEAEPAVQPPPSEPFCSPAAPAAPQPTRPCLRQP